MCSLSIFVKACLCTTLRLACKMFETRIYVGYRQLSGVECSSHIARGPLHIISTSMKKSSLA